MNSIFPLYKPGCIMHDIERMRFQIIYRFVQVSYTINWFTSYIKYLTMKREDFLNENEMDFIYILILEIKSVLNKNCGE